MLPMRNLCSTSDDDEWSPLATDYLLYSSHEKLIDVPIISISAATYAPAAATHAADTSCAVYRCDVLNGSLAASERSRDVIT